MPDITIQQVLGRYDGTRLNDTAYVVAANNVLLEKGLVARRRPSLATVSLTSGPSSTIYQLARYQPADVLADTELWAFSGTSSAHRRVSGTWNSVSLAGSVASFASNTPRTATFNGKLYLAYNTADNRLHLWDGTTVRNVGVGRSAAATVANTGAGAYPATLRYYKIQFQIRSGSDVIATSELSTSVSFTPSGGGTAARITKPTTPDSATHWLVYASSDGVTYYGPVTNGTYTDGVIAVANTTFDDSTTVANYVTLTVAPSAGLYVPPPSCKFLLATDNRLLMAGAWETTVSSGTAGIDQTAPKNSRVWFTDPLGALDETGEDEAVAQVTGDRFNWVDVGENDGDAITGMAGPLAGLVYVFKARSVWRLIPTGIPEDPFRAERVTDQAGADVQESITMGEDGGGNPAIYFNSRLGGPRRINMLGGIDTLAQGAPRSGVLFGSTSVYPVAAWDNANNVLWWFTSGGAVAAYQPEFEQQGPFGLIGGWTTHNWSFAGSATPRCAVMAPKTSSSDVLYVGGGSTAVLGTLDGATVSDMGGSNFDATLATHVFRPSLRGLVRVTRPVLAMVGNQGAYTVQLTSAIGTPFVPTTPQTLSGTAGSTNYVSYSVGQETVEGLSLGDMAGFFVTITWPTADAVPTARPGVLQLVIPWTEEGVIA